MKICENGVYRELTPEEEAAYEKQIVVDFPQTMSYEDRVEFRVRQYYTISQEFAIQRQRFEKPEEFEIYNNLIEQIKAEEKAREGL